MTSHQFDRHGQFSPNDSARRAQERDAAHIGAFLDLLRNPEPDAAKAMEALYLIKVGRKVLWELIGFSLRGHPSVVLCAVEMARHAGGTSENARVMLGQFLAKPPHHAAVQGVGQPSGLVRAVLPRVTETMPEFFDRVRTSSSPGPALNLDADLVDFAFDFRVRNPSELEHMKIPKGNVNPLALRTAAGHLLSATGHGLYHTLLREAEFVTVTDVVQHRPERSHRLPTICMHRKFLAIEQQVNDGQVGALDTLALHPACAHDEHLFGAACGELLG